MCNCDHIEIKVWNGAVSPCQGMVHIRMREGLSPSTFIIARELQFSFIIGNNIINQLGPYTMSLVAAVTFTTLTLPLVLPRYCKLDPAPSAPIANASAASDSCSCMGAGVGITTASDSCHCMSAGRPLVTSEHAHESSSQAHVSPLGLGGAELEGEGVCAPAATVSLPSAA